MLELLIVLSESFDELTSEFSVGEATTIKLEHSLVSLSKWEQKYEKPFLTTQMTPEETLDYIIFMGVEPFPPEILAKLSEENVDAITKYINSQGTATTINASSSKPSRQIITSELIYSWMVAFNIPFVTETWFLNRLLTLIRVCDEAQKPQKKLSPAELARRNRELNQKRRAELGSSG